MDASVRLSGEERDSKNFPKVPPEASHGVLVCCIPEVDDPIGTRGGNKFTIRRKTALAPYCGRVARQFVDHNLLLKIPNKERPPVKGPSEDISHPP